MLNSETPIYKALQKIGMEYLDVDFHIERLFSFQENIYFMPTNKNEQDYSICSLLAQINLIEVKKTPKWRDGFCCGVANWFKYKKDLQY